MQLFMCVTAEHNADRAVDREYSLKIYFGITPLKAVLYKSQAVFLHEHQMNVSLAA